MGSWEVWQSVLVAAHAQSGSRLPCVDFRRKWETTAPAGGVSTRVAELGAAARGFGPQGRCAPLGSAGGGRGHDSALSRSAQPL